MNTNPNSAPASAGQPAAKTGAASAAPAKPAEAPKQPDPKAPTAADAKPAGDAKPADAGKPAEAAQPEEPKPDPFANLPRIKLADADNILDMSGVECSAARKYEKVHTDAVGAKLPMQRDWKHREAVFVPGTNKGGENGFKQGSVYGTIVDIVTRAGRQGVEAQELVTLVRQRQVGNKRSHFCEKLPPVGWAEGWINTAVTKNYVGIHPTKKARALVVAPKGEESTPAQDAAAAKAKAA